MTQMTSEVRQALSSENLRLIDAWWRAANHLSAGQVYLLDNPLLREPLRSEDIKPRLPGHWGTVPKSQLHLRAPEPGHEGARPERDFHYRHWATARRPSRTGHSQVMPSARGSTARSRGIIGV